MIGNTFLILFSIGLSAAIAYTAESSTSSELQKYLAQAERQTETVEQCIVLKQALCDILNLPAQTLKSKRYKNFSETENQWTSLEVIRHHLVPISAVALSEHDLLNAKENSISELALRNAVRKTADCAFKNELAKILGEADPNSIRINETSDFSSGKIQYSLDIGEGGIEICKALYNTKGKLKTLSCDYEYVSHSMGPRNLRTIIKSERQYQTSGKLFSVRGQIKTQKLNGTGIHTKPLKKESSELGLISKPILNLNPILECRDF